MISKTELKYFTSLLQKKYRDKEGKFIAEGKRIVEEGLKFSAAEKILFTNEFKKNNPDFFENIAAKDRIAELREQDFNKLSDTLHSQGIAAVFKKNSHNISEINFEKNLMVFLDDISDPGNLGTIIRNCDWFGVDQIMLSENCTDIFNSKAVRASMGSIFHINIFENISPDFFKILTKNGYKILAADIQGENLFKENFSDKNVIIFSNEAHGLSPEVEVHIDKKITIPKLGKAESLNVANACAVFLSRIQNR
jgi:RNA methyltransferase, TrmH family